ncbi:MAG: PTS sugar transporter subunit IIA [Holophagales bacterium]|nr:PTS sugar transporter subunit IIA [Holophagales bacterium]
MFLDSLADEDLMFPDLAAYDVPTLLRGFATRIVAERPALGSSDDLYQALWEREQLGSTGIGQGVAVPHCKIRGIDRVMLAVGHVEKGIDFASVDGAPARLFFTVVSPESQPAAHLQCLAAISRWIKDSGEIEKLLAARDAKQMFGILAGRGSRGPS